MADRLTGIEVFVEAMRLGGLSSAARVLHMSPAMAAKHLSALEGWEQPWSTVPRGASR
jgi:DNA-binding transcriptional LysR family regulator